LNPVRGYTMLKFLEWLSRNYPQIVSLKGLSEADLLRLADMFEGGKLAHNKSLGRKWRAGFDTLLRRKTDWEGYDAARQFLRDLQSAREGSLRPALMRDIVRFGGRPKSRSFNSSSPDPVQRYRTVPLHAVFLYSSEDNEVQEYLLAHWGALDSLSGNFCDIYPSVKQLRRMEDAYDLIDTPGPLRGIEEVSVSQLPGLFFWDRWGSTEYVPLRRTRPRTTHDRVCHNRQGAIAAPIPLGVGVVEGVLLEGRK
jgi:hypothetical protein